MPKRKLVNEVTATRRASQAIEKDIDDLAERLLLLQAGLSDESYQRVEDALDLLRDLASGQLAAEDDAEEGYS